MSSSIAIPKRSKQVASGYPTSTASASSVTPPRQTTSSFHTPSSSSAASSIGSSGSTMGSCDGKGKARAEYREERHERRPSLLSSSLSRSEHTVVNIGDPDGVPRLITCVKTSQGFDWNQEIFLPSYASDSDYSGELERRQDPVEDIFITEEEAEGMFPR